MMEKEPPLDPDIRSRLERLSVDPSNSRMVEFLIRVDRIGQWVKSLPPNWAASRCYSFKAFVDWFEAIGAQSCAVPSRSEFEDVLDLVECGLEDVQVDGVPAVWKRPYLELVGTTRRWVRPAGILQLADRDDCALDI